MNAAQKDLYRILGIAGSAESAVIRAAYKALIMIYHPDRYDGDKNYAIKKSKEINEAYAVLIDPDKRKKYDAQRSDRPGFYANGSEHELDKVLSELKKLLMESEIILKILNEPD